MNKVTIERSNRLDGIGEYYFSRKLREISEIEAATGRQIIRLAMGSPDLPPHQSVIDRLAQEAQRPDVHKYMSYQGEPILRKAFADWYKRYYNVEVDYRSEVLPLLGSKEGLMHICQTFLNVGDKVLVPNPGYPTYSAAVKLSGGVMVTYSLNKETGFLPDFEAIEAAGLEGVKMMLVNYPNMPTGQTPTPDLFEKLVAFGAKHNILIIHDNPYSFVRNPQPMSILQVEGAMEVAMELNSLSKGHSMAGWRVGAIFAKKEWIDAILCFKSNMDSGMFYPVQAAAETALGLGDDWFKELNDIYYAREKQGYELLDALGCSYRKGQAGLFIWAELPESYEGDSFQFSDEVMEKCDVFVTPGAIFGSEGKRYVRITLCCPAELLEKAAQRVRERLNK
ncbi:MAG: aminotransferase class I/II-fold pyridoxal phosphate-dependent enzyme [Rikenellaceae bacterium]|nr:aminotransferase class I/II-fold pyridoxal phosphate-dependent enzyme [Rikenellaceae bacterium]